jgi:hypothetical protein
VKFQASAAATLALALSGCASGGPSGRDVLTGSIAPDKSRIVIYRPSILGLAVQPNYVVDGKAVAASAPQGFIVCEVAPGPHQLAVENAQLNVSFGSGSDQAKLDLKPGQTAYLKAEMQMGLTVGHLTLTEVTETQGRTDTAELSKVAATCGV